MSSALEPRAIRLAFDAYPAELVDILLRVRAIALRIRPHAAERLRATGITLYDPKKGGTVTGGICFVDVRDGLVRIRFGLGAFLDDPKGLLSGCQKYMRQVDIDSLDVAPWEEIEALIRASAELEGWRTARENMSDEAGAVLDSEARLRAAMEQADLAELDRLTHPGLVFVIPSGQVVSKKEDLAAYRAGRFSIARAAYSEESIAPAGDGFVTTVRADLRVTWRGETRSTSVRYLRVWKKDREWRVVAGSATPISS